ncbi:class I SAM-dependent methyltransferase [bacterium]|nr:class I SAM-dependent methyltransferase [bacterium]
MITEKDRIRSIYTARNERLAGSGRYSVFHPAGLFMAQHRQRDVLRLMRQEGILPLSGKDILEVGCGGGGVLQEYLIYGASPGQLHGCDLLCERLHAARSLLPNVVLTVADGQYLPYAAGLFDVALQYTVFTSILDDGIKANVAREMLRVIRRGGIILWYDFWLNPINQQTKGIRKAEIRRLFPGCSFKFHRITLAPPLARRLVPLSWILCLMLEKLRILNTHYLVAIRKM